VSLNFVSFQQVPAKAGTPGVAQDGTSQSQAGGSPQQQGSPPGSMFTMLLPFLIFIPLLFVMFRRQKKEQEARKTLKKGDRVVSTSGLVGELVDLTDMEAKVKIAPGTTVTMLANAISPYPTAAQKAPAQELKDAKAVSEKK
jgi:preprotein translocase subunit YajC